MHSNVLDVLDELVEKRDLDRTVLSHIISEGVLAAYKKKYPELPLKAECNSQEGGINVSIEKTVVSSVQDEELELSLKKARGISQLAQLGDMMWVPFDGSIGRIEIIRARQVIASMIRKVEADAVYNEFKKREGDIVHGVIHKCGRSGTVIKVEDALAFLPQSLSIPTDKFQVGFSVRALLKEVLPEPRNDNQLILDRASETFLQRLFELEIPEVFERLVEVKKIVRIAGYKSKIMVVSNDRNIDPVGTCIGVGGARIKPILKELGGEKIDIISSTESVEELVRGALKPARVNRVELTGTKGATVWVDEDQRSLAIGRVGQNIALASKLTGIDIQISQDNKNESRQRGSQDSLDLMTDEE